MASIMRMRCEGPRKLRLGAANKALKSHKSQSALGSQALVPGLARNDLAGQADQTAPRTRYCLSWWWIIRSTSANTLRADFFVIFQYKSGHLVCLNEIPAFTSSARVRQPLRDMTLPPPVAAAALSSRNRWRSGSLRLAARRPSSGGSLSRCHR